MLIKNFNYQKSRRKSNCLSITRANLTGHLAKKEVKNFYKQAMIIKYVSHFRSIVPQRIGKHAQIEKKRLTKPRTVLPHSTNTAILYNFMSFL